MLEELYAGALSDAEQRLNESSIAELTALAESRPAPLDAISFLSAGNTINLIAEIKRASPSKGFLAEISDPAALALTYESSGGAAISVLTEEGKFKGSLRDLAEVRKAVRVPILRKDFIAIEQQVLEARATGADIVLLIVAGLDQSTLQHLVRFVESFGMTAFVETHNQDELLRAIDTGANLIGINARDLSTFDTDRELFATLVELLPRSAVAVAESAVRDVADVMAYAAAGADCVLVGEALVTGDAAALLNSFKVIPKIRL